MKSVNLLMYTSVEFDFFTPLTISWLWKMAFNILLRKRKTEHFDKPVDDDPALCLRDLGDAGPIDIGEGQGVQSHNKNLKITLQNAEHAGETLPTGQMESGDACGLKVPKYHTVNSFLLVLSLYYPFIQKGSENFLGYVR
jgi:hypothetical protein